MSGARLAGKGVVSLSFLRDLHPLHSYQLAWRTTILPPTGIDPNGGFFGSLLARVHPIMCRRFPIVSDFT